MANITDVQFVKFHKEKTRPLADRLESLRLNVEAYKAEWATNLATVNQAGHVNGDEVEDGSHTDGREITTKFDAMSTWVVLQAVADLIEGLAVDVAADASVLGEIQKVSVNPKLL